ncbi:MAG: AI-2E family transporter [Chthonomonadales bacterium]|nr:AI-2E family transporter [Chthonomonadales bacterium]
MTPRGAPQAADVWVTAVVKALWRNALYGGAIVLAVYVIGRLRVVIISLFIAATIAYVMRPMAEWLMQQTWFVAMHGGAARLPNHVRRALATFYVLVLLGVAAWYAGRFMVNPFITEVRNAAENWDEYRADLDSYGQDVQAWYSEHVKPEWRAWLAEQAERSKAIDFQRQAGQWFTAVVRHVSDAAHYIIEILLLPVLAFYFALDSKRLKHEFVGALPARSRREVLRMVREFNLIMYSFVVGQAILCAVAGIVVGLGLAALNVKYPLTLGILAGLTRAIPVIGPIIGGIPIVLLVLVTKGMGVALGVLAFFTFLHFAESKFLMPYVIGERMSLHPVVIIVVLLIGQEFGGLLGMFFAAPVAALVRVIVRRYWLKTHRRAAPPARSPYEAATLTPPAA